VLGEELSKIVFCFFVAFLLSECLCNVLIALIKFETRESCDFGLEGNRVRRELPFLSLAFHFDNSHLFAQ